MSKFICTIEEKNTIDIFTDHAEIILQDRYHNEVARAIIDLDDVDKCKEFRWRISENGLHEKYVRNDLGVFLQRFILDVYDSSKRVKIIDRNAFDCRKANLYLKGVDNVTPTAAEVETVEPIEQPVEPIMTPEPAPALITDPLTDRNYRTIYHTNTGYIVLLEYDGELLDLGRYDSEVEARKTYDDMVKFIYMKLDPLGFYN